MKLFMNKNEKYEEPEVHMFFHKQTKEVEQVEKFVRSLSITVPVQYEDEIYKIISVGLDSRATMDLDATIKGTNVRVGEIYYEK